MGDLLSQGSMIIGESLEQYPMVPPIQPTEILRFFHASIINWIGYMIFCHPGRNASCCQNPGGWSLIGLGYFCHFRLDGTFMSILVGFGPNPLQKIPSGFI